jgi:queuine/archaeosine tRNA-ribosyltransferase
MILYGRTNTYHLSLDSKSRIYKSNNDVQGVPEMDGKILTMSYWLHVELGKNI